VTNLSPTHSQAVPCYRAWGLHVCKNAETRKNVETPGAAFYKESRMKFVDLTKFDRKSGRMGHSWSLVGEIRA
jgi:hypothetical protein